MIYALDVIKLTLIPRVVNARGRHTSMLRIYNTDRLYIAIINNLLLKIINCTVFCF